MQMSVINCTALESLLVCRSETEAMKFPIDTPGRSFNPSMSTGRHVLAGMLSCTGSTCVTTPVDGIADKVLLRSNHSNKLEKYIA